ncbi:MAG TPA: hypothetical protein VLA25_04075 [Methylotenera sp.]|nr:hypothetical protein [Methylotenera sp.]
MTDFKWDPLAQYQHSLTKKIAIGFAIAFFLLSALFIHDGMPWYGSLFLVVMTAIMIWLAILCHRWLKDYDKWWEDRIRSKR